MLRATEKRANIADKEDMLDALLSLSKTEKTNIIRFLEKSIKQEEDCPSIPISAFQNKKLSGLECSVKYMKENLEMKNINIARMLNRSDKTTWITYQNATKKYPLKFITTNNEFAIPISLFADRRLGILEHLIVYLREQENMANNEISSLLSLKYSTIASAYSTARKKLPKIHEMKKKRRNKRRVKQTKKITTAK